MPQLLSRPEQVQRADLIGNKRVQRCFQRLMVDESPDAVKGGCQVLLTWLGGVTELHGLLIVWGGALRQRTAKTGPSFPMPHITQLSANFMLRYAI